MLERPQDEDSHVAVLDVINDADLGQIGSIAVTGTHIRNIFVEGGKTQLSHAPVTAEVLRAAATELVESGATSYDQVSPRPISNCANPKTRVKRVSSRSR